MAARLVAAGHTVTVWNRTSKPLVGATAADTPGGAASGAEIVITMLSGPAAVESVLFGENGAASAMRADTVLVEMSTIGPDAVRAIAARLPCAMVDAPVGGSVDKAEAGELTIFTGGEPADVDRVAPVLAAMGTVERVGGPGSAAAAKLVVNTALIAGLALLGELRELAATLDVDAERFLAAGPMGALVRRSEGKGAHFTMDLAAKDLALAVDHGGDLPLTRAALARARAAVPNTGGRDVGALADPTKAGR
ncbi:2-hydroxy-3-oxopropionate reductase [Alloactinosynnema sp. L-07]|nr:2-hydroxy-3-oxopropionate reductase [Alloactinosynnema sp. L-07]